ncbi:MAG: antitoxin [Alphaproteobacteria bacterium]|nr:antitoxin [Alphaproteobacteria bacterium]
MTRTTVTLDPDVEQLLRDAMQRRRQSFKEALNQAVRNGLADTPPAEREGRFKVRARPMGLRTGIDPARLNQLADEMEADAFLALSGKLAAGARRAKPK